MCERNCINDYFEYGGHFINVREHCNEERYHYRYHYRHYKGLYRLNVCSHCAEDKGNCKTYCDCKEKLERKQHIAYRSKSNSKLRHCLTDACYALGCRGHINARHFVCGGGDLVHRAAHHSYHVESKSNYHKQRVQQSGNYRRNHFCGQDCHSRNRSGQKGL